MRHILPMLGLALFLQGSLRAQTCDEKTVTYGMDLDEVLIYKVLRTSDGNFLLAGQKNVDAVVMKVDACGDVLWEKTHTFGEEQAFRDVVEVNGQFVAAGYCTECRTGDPARKILVQALTLNGDKSGAAKTLGPSALDADGQRIRTLSGGRFAVVGSRTITQGNTTGSAMTVYLLSASLATQASQFYLQKKINEAAYDIVELPGGGFVLAGSSIKLSAPVSSVVRLIGANADLSEAWSVEHYDVSTNKEQGARAIGQLPDGDLLIVGSRVAGGTLQAFAARINATNGAVLDEASFGSNGDDLGRDLQILGDDDILLCGMRAQFGVADNPWALMLNGDLDQKDAFELNSQGVFNSCTAFQENGETHFAFAGTLITFPFQGVFARTLSLSTATEEFDSGEEFTLYPNPARDQVLLRGPSLPHDARFRLYRKDGGLCLDVPAQPVIDLPRLAAGTYLAVLEWGGNRMARTLMLAD
jgi:hypothetical protein